MTRTIIAIDPGTKCGWCVRSRDGSVIAGLWRLAGDSRHESRGMRFIRFERSLVELVGSYPACSVIVAYEEVRRHMGVDAAHIYGAIVGLIQKVCTERKIEFLAIPVGTVKKLATGKGNAKKDAMIAAAKSRWPAVPIEDDNQADAMFIAEAAAREIGA